MFSICLRIHELDHSTYVPATVRGEFSQNWLREINEVASTWSGVAKPKAAYCVRAITIDRLYVTISNDGSEVLWKRR